MTKIFPEQLSVEIAKILDTKKARDIKILEVLDKTTITDYFVIAAGTSSTHVKSLADEVEYELKTKLGIECTNIEGRGLGNWILLDFESVIVHVFNPQTREFYNLEKLWSECKEIPFDQTAE